MKIYLLRSARGYAALFLMLLMYWVPVCADNPDTDRYPGTNILEPLMTKEFDLDGSGILKTYTFAGNIEVMSHSQEGKVRVELYVERGYSFWSNSKNLSNYRITMKQVGNQVISSVERKEKERGFFSDEMTFSYKIYVPKNISSELRTSAGNIQVYGLQGTHNLKSFGGHITLDSLRGRVEAFTSGGNISIQNSEGKIYGQTNGGNISLVDNSGDLRFRTNGGQITGRGISGSMLSEVNGGNIDINFLNITEGIDLKTTAGNITITLPKEIGFDINMAGMVIDLASDIAFEGVKKSGAVNGQIYEGGIPVNLKATYGKIAVNVKN